MMKKNVLFILALTWLSMITNVAIGSNPCGADTTFFLLPQNEFNTERSWYFKPQTSQEQWVGGVNYYEMYDPCIVMNNTLVITEVNANANPWNAGTYIEITNLGTEAIDLSEYRIIGQRNASAYPALKIDRMSHLDLSGILDAGQSYVIMGYNKYANVEKGVMDRTDSISEHNNLMAELAGLTYPVSKAASPVPYLVGRGVDIVYPAKNANVSLAKVIGDSIEVVVDVFGQLYVDGGTATIAGVLDAASNYTLVRKKFTGDRKYGNTNFVIAKGSEAAEASEWILLPKFRNSTTHLPTTIGSHIQNSEYQLSAKANSGVTIDETNAIIHLPWGVYRGDSVMSFFNVGADMTWEYQTNGFKEDETSNLVHEHDTIIFYHCGIDVTIKKYKVEVHAPSEDANNLACLNRSSDLERMYNETNLAQIDTIYGRRLYHDYPKDTLFKYIEYASNASIDMVWKDGDDPRPTLKDGDILRVTSKSGMSHDYYIALVPYEDNILSHDARLGNITWPDYPQDELDEYVWTTGDTIPGFNKDAYTYIINLPVGASRIPALTAKVNNPRAKVKSVPAKNLYGSAADQTTKFIVTAEDDSTVMEYSVRFLVENDDWSYDGSPYFSELSDNLGTAGMIFEIYNPGNTLLDLSDYVVAGGKYDWKNIEGLLKWSEKFFDNTHIYRPGYVFDSLKMASVEQYWFDPNGDASVDAYVDPGSCFTIAVTSHADKWGMVDPRTGSWSSKYDNGVVDGPSVILHEVNEDSTWSYNKHGGFDGGKLGRVVGTFYKENTYFLLKIVNDSVKNGTKGAVDPADFEIVDVIGKIETGKTLGWLDPLTGAPIDAQVNDFYMLRKPEVFKGNPISMGSFGYAGIETPVDYDETTPLLGDTTAFEWIYNLSRPSNYNTGTHTMNPVTEYKSTIASVRYNVSLGLSMDESIVGVEANTSLEDFLANIYKTDEGQSLVVKNSNGNTLEPSDVIQENNVLTVTSANGDNQSAYKIQVGALGSNVLLSSSVYEVTDAEVKISSRDLTIKEVAENLTVDAKSQMYMVDKNEGLTAYTAFDYRDSVYYEARVNNNLYVKVIAQNSDSKLYRIVLPSTSSDAYLTANVFNVDNALKHINGVEAGINVTELVNNLYPSTGATVRVLNKWGQVKSFGIVLFNDVVEVVSEDGSVTVIYGITLNTEIEPEEELLIHDGKKQNRATVFPNPTKGVVTFATAFASAKVYDITGALVLEHNEEGKSLDLSTLLQGIYIITVADSDQQFENVKIIKR